MKLLTIVLLLRPLIANDGLSNLYKLSLSYSRSKGLRVLSYNAQNVFPNEFSGKWSRLNSPLKKKCSLSQHPKAKRFSKCLRLNWTYRAYKQKIEQVAKVIIKESPDIAFIQELEAKRACPDLALTLGAIEFYCSKQVDRRGMGMALFKLKEKSGLINIKELSGPKMSRPLLEVQILHQRIKHTIIALHFPSKLSKKNRDYTHWESLGQRIRELKIQGESEITVLGDFNLELDEINKDFRKRFPMLSFYIPRRSSYFYKRKCSWETIDWAMGFHKRLKVRVYVSRRKYLLWPIICKGKRVFAPMKYCLSCGKKLAGYSDHLPLILILQTDGTKEYEEVEGS